MAKMHELLAVEADAQGQFKNILAETKNVFGKGNLFIGHLRKLEMFEDDGVKHPEERAELTTTVATRLDYNNKAVVKYFDVLLQKESTNQVAKADVVVDGKTLAAGLPATFLLGMESRLRELRDVYVTIPTLTQAVRWEKDEGMGTGVYRAAFPEEKLKTSMKFKSQVLYAATKEHPAQIEKWEEQVPVGKYVKDYWCGMITPARKSELLGRIDVLIAAVKKARQRANSTEVVKNNIGKALMGFINK